jgi:hypothetical protein
VLIETDHAKCLWRISERAVLLGVLFLAEQPNVVAHAEQAFQQPTAQRRTLPVYVHRILPRLNRR